MGLLKRKVSTRCTDLEMSWWEGFLFGRVKMTAGVKASFTRLETSTQEEGRVPVPHSKSDR